MIMGWSLAPKRRGERKMADPAFALRSVGPGDSALEHMSEAGAHHLPAFGRRSHQILQAFSRTMGCPGLHENAWANSGRFATMPLIRYLPGECGSVAALTR